MDKKILYIITHLRLGGAQKSAHELSKIFSKTVFVAFQGGVLEKKFYGVKVLRVPNVFFAMILWKLFWIIRKEKPDIIHTHLWHADVFGGFLALLLRIPWVSTEHSVNWGQEGWLKHALKRSLLRGASGVVAISKKVAEYVQEAYRVPIKKIRIIYYGFSEKQFFYLPYPVQDPSRMACIGRFDYVKGQDLLLEIIKKISIPAEYWFMGDGPTRKILEEQGRGAAHVQFLGTRHDIQKVFQQIHVVAVPSRQEGFGRVALEAAFCGRPVVAFRVGGLEEIIQDGKTGFLIDPGDFKNFQIKLEYLLTHPKEAEVLGKNASIFAQKTFSFEKMKNRYTELYTSL